MYWSQPICEEIFKRKYMSRGESSPEQVLSFVAEAIASVEGNKKNKETYRKEFLELLNDVKLLPAGRILSNARLDDGGIKNLNNCFTIELEDSMHGIFDALKEDALIQQQGGGVGFDLSKLRPKGASISKGGHSSGVISFLSIFNESAKSIHTGGDRRGAHIALLDISHPDIEEFITAKHGEENNALTQFNISVKVTDAFMEAVKQNSDWDLTHGDKVYKTVKARYLFDLLCANAFKYNEPGLFFVDTVNRFNNVPTLYNISSCNPCFSGDTLVATGEGLKPIESLVGKPTLIYDGREWIEVDTFKKMGENQVLYRVTMGSGLHYDCTANHNWILANGTRKQTCELALGYELQHADAKTTYSSKLKRHHRVMSIEVLPGLHDVFCCEVETTHAFMLSGRNMTSNCGEQPLAPYQACCLGALNYSSFLKQDRTIKSSTSPYSFDWDGYIKAIHASVRFLDNVVTFTDYPLEKNKVIAMDYRRIGLGYTALADALALLGYAYDSEEGLAFSEELAKTLRNESYRASALLAKEKGMFPALRRNGGPALLMHTSEFIKTLPEDIQKLISKYGLRNVALNTVAPTGTISFSLGQNCSSGIEPIFSLSYKRTIRVGAAEGEETKTETVWDYGWLVYVMNHKSGDETLDAAAERLQKELKDSPNNPFKTTFDMLPEAHLRMQAMWQKYIDSSISKTMNLPSGFKLDSYGELVTKAFEAGLKGFTTFNPDGAMKGILQVETPTVSVNATEVEKPIITHNAPRRPDELPCDIHIMNYRGEKYVVLVGMYQGKVYEAFVTLLTDELHEQLDSFKTGYIVKHNKGQYSLFVDADGSKKQLIKNLGKTFNSTFETVARMISMSMRHGVPLKFVIDQLMKGRDVQAFERILARVIKKYIADGEKATAVCETCGVPLEYREGCLTCPTCGASKCG